MVPNLSVNEMLVVHVPLISHSTCASSSATYMRPATTPCVPDVGVPLVNTLSVAGSSV